MRQAAIWGCVGLLLLSMGGDIRLRLLASDDDSMFGKKVGEVRSLTNHPIKFCWCPPGSFRMGSPESDKSADDDEKPQVDVTLSQGFWLGQTEVTQGQWKSVMGTEPWVELGDTDRYKAGAAYPAVYINYEDALAFCRKLTSQERRAGRLPSDWKYQLPTEAQWECACRAGTETRYSFGEDASNLGDYAWFDENAWDLDEKYAHRVGQKRSNRWGLRDMHGNVWEWSRDIWADKLAGGRDPLVTSGGSVRVLRGGCWGSAARGCRSANRNGRYPSYWFSSLGFRLASVPAGQ